MISLSVIRPEMVGIGVGEGWGLGVGEDGAHGNAPSAIMPFMPLISTEILFAR